MTFYSIHDPIRYEGPSSTAPLAFRWYDPSQVILGKTMAEHLRFAVCYWHTLCWPGLDPFGGETFMRPWQQPGDPMAQARVKADVAFEMFRLLGVPFFTFHDRDIAPELRVARLVDLAHAASAEQGLQVISTKRSSGHACRYQAGHHLHCCWQRGSGREPVGRPGFVEERFNVAPQLFVIAAGSSEIRPALARRAGLRGVIQRFDALPAFRIHGRYGRASSSLRWVTIAGCSGMPPFYVRLPRVMFAASVSAT